jgi:hypothetical protein
VIYRLLADLTVALHFGFLIFVVAGAFLVRRFRWVMVPHLLCVARGVYVEVMGPSAPHALRTDLAARQQHQGLPEHYLRRHLP